MFVTIDVYILLELEQGILIQTIEKKRHRRLGSKGVLTQDRAEHRIRGKLIRIVVIEVVLIRHLILNITEILFLC